MMRDMSSSGAYHFDGSGGMRDSESPLAQYRAKILSPEHGIRVRFHSFPVIRDTTFPRYPGELLLELA